MAGGQNLATKFVHYIDEQFTRESQIGLALTNSSEYKGDKTFKIYSFPVVPLVDYTMSGTSRYGTPIDIERNIQTVVVSQDKAFNYIVDNKDKLQSEMLTDAGKQLARQMALVNIPLFDTYCFKKLADAAIENGAYDTTSVTASNAYTAFLKARQWMGDHDVPDSGIVCFCTYAYANLLMQDPAFMRYGNLSQEMINKGVLGECDGVKIVKVSPSRLPAGAAFLMTHAIAACAPKQLDEYKMHDNPPGVSGVLVEGRMIFDCFIFDEKADAIYYCGGQGVLKNLKVFTGAASATKCSVTLVADKETSTNKWYYKTASTKAGLPAVTYNTAIAPSTSSDDWYQAVELTAARTEIEPSTDKYIRVVEVDGTTLKPIAFGDARVRLAEN